MGGPADQLCVASFNVHAGIDGWGRRFDVAATCRELDADILVLQEVWAPDDGPAMGAALAQELGYRCFWYPMARGRRGQPRQEGNDKWQPTRDVRTAANALYIDGERPEARRVRRSPRYGEAEPGSWGLAVLARVPVLRSTTVELGRMPGDRGRRGVLIVVVERAGTEVVVAGTHMSHLSSGSPVQFRALRWALDEHVGTRPGVLAGDLNLWGPPTVALLPGWRRAVKGRTWPAWRPHSQPDHVLVRGVDVLEGTVLAHAGSDHRPIRARLGITAS